jgi:hypothetical protein
LSGERLPSRIQDAPLSLISLPCPHLVDTPRALPQTYNSV